MKIGNRSVFRFFIERVLPAATGGYTSYSDQPDIVLWTHTIIYMWLFVAPIVLVLVDEDISPYIHPSVTAFIWLVIKSVNYYFNRQFDRRSEVPAANFESIHVENLEAEANTPPYGISPSIWRVREQITDFQNIDIDTMVDNLIQQGYNAAELFHFYDVYQRGLLNISNGENRNENHAPTVPTTIKFFCCSYVITWSRKDLEKWFDRPISLLECFFCPLAAFACGILAFHSALLVSFPAITIMFLSSASAQFALLKAPNPDSFSTIYQEKLTPYSRAFHFILFQLLFILGTYLLHNESTKQAIITVFEIQIKLEDIIYYIKEVLKYIILLFPFLNALGIFGSLKASWFFTLEMLQMIFSGSSGAVTFVSANISFIMIVLVICFLTFLHRLSNSPYMLRFSVALSYFCGLFISSFAYVPFLAKHFFEKNDYYVPRDISKSKRFLISLSTSLISAIFVYILMLFDFSGSHLFLSIISSFLITSGIVNHIMFPHLMSRYPFKIWSSPFFENSPYIQKYLSISSFIEKHVLAPITLASIFKVSEGKEFGFNSWVESFLAVTMIIYVSNMSFHNISRLCIVMAINSMSNSQFDFVLFHTYFYLIVIWKLSEFLEKLDYVYTYSSLHSVTSRIQLLCLIAMFANVQFTVLSVALSCVLTSPLIPLFGSALFLPSFSRPTAFWFDHLSYQKKKGDSLFYNVISESLADSLASMVSNGYFLTLVENNFFLICDNYFNAIIHIIEAGNDYVVFQLRGLEVRDQTLCHINELNIVRNGLENIEEPKVFVLANFTTKITYFLLKFVDYFCDLFGLPRVLPRQQYAFLKSSAWSIWSENLSILSYSVSAIDIDQIFPDRESQSKILINLIRVLTLVLEEADGIVLPDQYQFIEPNEEIHEWVQYHCKERMLPVILSISKAILDAMMIESSASFGWKLFQYFEGKDLKLSSYSWIPSNLEQKLLDSFRVTISIAAADIAYTLPDTIEELSQFIKSKIAVCNIMPETDPRWEDLIDMRMPELETLRQFNDPNGVMVKYMIFSLRNQPFRIVKINDELVRGIWAEQIVETVFVESDDRERGSVQFDMFTLRNIISQSTNPPAGYPETICPITFSFS